MDAAEQDPAQGVAVVVVPFLEQGHLNQLLHLSLLLSSHGLTVHYASSATHNRQARGRVHGWDADSLNKIHFHDLPLPHFPTPPPDPNAATKFPTHLQPAFEASEHLRAPLASLLKSLSAASRRLVIVHDPLMAFAGSEAASHPNTEVYIFHCIPAFFMLPFYWKLPGNEADPPPEILDVILASFEESVPQAIIDFSRRQSQYRTNVKAGNLINSCRPIEGEFIDLLAQQPSYRGNKFFPIGPLNPIAVKRDGSPRHECLEWLDKQPPASVLYVSFGTTSTFSDEEIEHLAAGLQRSQQRFIWVLRDADRGDIFAADGGEANRRARLLPDYEREMEGVGIVISGWAPQLEILAHPSTGGFVSHCGWNSCLESLSMGVPILAWPMHSDQPRNAMVVTEYLKVGVMVRGWAQREETVSSGEIAAAIKRVFVCDEGEEIRKRAKALGGAIRQAVSEGGSSRAELISFIAHITR